MSGPRQPAREPRGESSGERVFRLFQIYLWAGAHLHRDGGLETNGAVFHKARGLPSTGIGVYAPR